MSTTLDDFKKAADYGSGVTLIPFEDMRREATSIADEVQRSKAASQYKYDTYQKQKCNLLKEKAKKEEAIKAKDKEIADFKSRHKESDVSSFEKDKEKLKKELEDIDKKIASMNKELEAGAEEWKRLWNARGGLREVFADVLAEVKNTLSNPQKYLGTSASDDDKKALDKALRTIADKIQREESEHKKQEDGAKGTEEKFRELIALDRCS